LAISKVKRRNRQEVKHIEQDYALTTRENIINLLKEAEDGMTFGEIYKKMTKMSPRTIRDHIQQLKNNGRLRMETCRCHAATVYYIL
jgi:predicted Zn-ribbon and HTH transcriptional regulator